MLRSAIHRQEQEGQTALHREWVHKSLPEQITQPMRAKELSLKQVILANRRLQLQAEIAYG